MTTVADKVKKLLALADSPNENEAQTAMLKAQELMVKHKLTMRDVEEVVEKQVVTMTTTHQKFRNTKWKAILGKVISDNFLCESLSQVNQNHSARVCFVGLEEDVDICVAVFNYAVKYVDKNVARLRRKYYDAGQSAKGVEEAYAIGFCHGLRENYMAQIKNNTEFGLVLVKDDRIKEAMDDLNVRQQTVHMNVDNMMAGMMGYSDGRVFSMADRLEGQCQSPMTD